jgi:DNA-binding SARP family transcriptional activator
MRETRLYISILGGFDARLRRPHRQIVLPARRAEALLAYLAVAPKRHRRDSLTALFWSDAPRLQGRQNLRQSLSAIRAALRPYQDDFILTSGDTVMLNPALVRTDAGAFRRLQRRQTSSALAAACKLYRGDLLDGINIPDPEFETWRATERASLRQLGLLAHETYLSRLIAAGRLDQAVQAALQTIAIDPLQEQVHRTLMRLYEQRGQIGAAIRQYETCARLLALELGIEPEPETQAVWQQLLRTRTVWPTERPARAAPRMPRPAGTAAIGVPSADSAPAPRGAAGHERWRTGNDDK